MKGEGEGEGEDEIGMEARGGLGGRAGRTVAELDWTLAWIRFSISSMSDWEDWWRGMVSLCDILLVFLVFGLEMGSEGVRERGDLSI